jgi:hypothetical protein
VYCLYSRLPAPEGKLENAQHHSYTYSYRETAERCSPASYHSRRSYTNVTASLRDFYGTFMTFFPSVHYTSSC